MRLIRGAAHRLQLWMTSLLLELHGRVEVGKTGAKGLQEKVQPPTPPQSQLQQTTCHPVQPSHGIQASPWANKDPFQASPYCDHAEQKRSVPLGRSLWSDPGFSLLRLYWFVQRNNQSGRFRVLNFLLALTHPEKVKKAELSHPLKCLWQSIGVFSVAFDTRRSWAAVFKAQANDMAETLFDRNFSTSLFIPAICWQQRC